MRAKLVINELTRDAQDGRVGHNRDGEESETCYDVVKRQRGEVRLFEDVSATEKSIEINLVDRSKSLVRKELRKRTR